MPLNVISICLLTDFAIYGASILPTLAIAELDPIPEFLTTVGYSSADHTYSVARPPVIQLFPINASVINNGCKAEMKYKKKMSRDM